MSHIMIEFIASFVFVYPWVLLVKAELVIKSVYLINYMTKRIGLQQARMPNESLI